MTPSEAVANAVGGEVIELATSLNATKEEILEGAQKSFRRRVEMLKGDPPRLDAFWLAEGPPTEDNWDSYGGKPTTKEAQDAARQFLSDIVSGRFHAVPTCKGGVAISEQSDENWIVEFGPDGEQVDE